MGTNYNHTVTIATEIGLVDIETEQINSIQKADDHGVLDTFQSTEGINGTILTVESFLRVLTYFKS